MSATFVYPRAEEVRVDPEVLSDQEVADVIVDWRESGHSKIRSELEALCICHNKAQVKEVSAKIDDEKTRLLALDPLKYATGVEFLNAIKAIAVLLDAATWVEFLQAKYDVSTFAELRAKLLAAADLKG